MAYDNRIRPGIVSSVTIDPKRILEDIDLKVRELEPAATPIQTITKYMGVGKPPKSHKIQVKQYHIFDNYDYCSAMTAGTGADARFANLTLDQPSRPSTAGTMYYSPQDKLFIVKTGQVVEIVMTERDSMPLGNNTFFSHANTTLTGNTTTRTSQGTVLVRTIDAVPIIPFTNSDVIYLGRTIYEGQPIQGESKQRDYIYDTNFVEHKEAVLRMTEDQVKLVQVEGNIPEWTFQQQHMLKEFKVSVDYNLLFSERSIDYTVPGGPKRHLRGLFNSIRTNVAVYDPMNVTNFEVMFGNFLYEQAFRYNTSQTYSKIGLAGGRFLFDFNQAFRQYRRTTSLEGVGKKIGLNFDTYVIPGGHTISLVRTEALRQGTPLENWCFVIDPKMMELRIKKNYESRNYSLATDRIESVMVEWQGTVAWHLEQNNALLRTA